MDYYRECECGATMSIPHSTNCNWHPSNNPNRVQEFTITFKVKVDYRGVLDEAGFQENFIKPIQDGIRTARVTDARVKSWGLKKVKIK